MALITYPTLLGRSAPSRLEWSLLSNVQVSTSPLNGSVQTLELPGARWRSTLFYDNMYGDDLALLQSFMVQLRGQANRFLLPYFPRPSPRGIGGGAPILTSGGQSGTQIIISGGPISISGWLKAGDCISFGTTPELHMVKADVATSGAGTATITFEPPIRVSPGGGAAVTTQNPVAHMMLIDSEVGWTVTNAGGPISDLVIACAEAF